MMKRLLFTLLALGCVALIVSCSSQPKTHTNYANGSIPLVKKITEEYTYEMKEYSYTTEYSYKYDKQNRVKSLQVATTNPNNNSQQTRQFEYEYLKGEILVKDLELDEITTAQLNNAGNVLSFTHEGIVHSFTYNAQHELVGVELTSDEIPDYINTRIANTWAHRNITNIMMSMLFEEVEDTVVVALEYGNIANTCSVLPQLLNSSLSGMVGHQFSVLPMGKKNAFLPSQVSIADVGESMTANYSYETDGDLVRKIVLNSPGEEDRFVVHIEY